MTTIRDREQVMNCYCAAEQIVERLDEILSDADDIENGQNKPESAKQFKICQIEQIIRAHCMVMYRSATANGAQVRLPDPIT